MSSHEGAGRRLPDEDEREHDAGRNDQDLRIALAIAAALEMHEARMHEPGAGTPAWADLHAN